MVTMAAAQDSCDADKEAIIDDCMTVIKKGEALQNSLRGEVNTLTAIKNAQEEDLQYYNDKLAEAQVWYRQPEYVAPAAAVLTTVLIFGLRK